MRRKRRNMHVCDVNDLIINKCSAIVTCIEHSLFLKQEIILRLYIYIHMHGVVAKMVVMCKYI